MEKRIQIILDDWFFDRFGFRFRESSLFCTGDIEIAKAYAGGRGQVRSVMPTGDFSFCWSPKVKDLYHDITINAQDINEFMESSHFKCSKLKDAIASGHEVMIVSKNVLARPL